MLYHVTARLREDRAAEFLTRLTDGTIAAQKPDGREIVAAMDRAVIDTAGTVEWSETCFCATPLAHERATVLDTFFEGLETEEIDAAGTYEGAPFMEHLRRLAGG